MPLDSSLIITTKEESMAIKHDNILLDSELDEDLAIAKAKIFSSLSNNENDTLLIGIDPGKRIGLSILYNYEEIDSRIVSINTLIELLGRLIVSIDAKKTIVRIGTGDLRLALMIAYEISHRFSSIDIELVDEYGTTSSITNARARRRGIRDRLSAKAIAYRRGRDLKEYIEPYTPYQDHYSV